MCACVCVCVHSCVCPCMCIGGHDTEENSRNPPPPISASCMEYHGGSEFTNTTGYLANPANKHFHLVIGFSPEICCSVLHDPLVTDITNSQTDKTASMNNN